jgi:MEMO1 family protein
VDPFVELARLTIHHFTRHQQRPREIPEEVRQALTGPRAATFVSLHTLGGELRGCMGTLEPWQSSLAEEIIQNAISACSRDSRFPPVRVEELDALEIQVDVLSPMEPILDSSALDVRRYGVLVATSDGRRGVLLPDLETITTVAEQIAIACRKAGIHPGRDTFTLARFTTARHA